MSIALLAGALELFDELPETDPHACHAALLEGRYIDASFHCPALTFLKGLTGFTGELDTFGPADEEDDDEEES